MRPAGHRTFAIAASAAHLAVLFASGAAAASDATGDTTVSVWNANESPLGLSWAIVTAWNPPAGYDVTLDAQASGGATVSCVGDNWYNPVRDSVSRKCYVELPPAEGDYYLTGRAVFSRTGFADLVVEGPGTRPVRSYGPASPERMTIDRAQMIDRCWNQTNRVQLTFDDGANAEKLRSILSTLRANGVRGRFFFTGKHAKKHPDRIRLIRRAGHLFGNHTYGHLNLRSATDEMALRQIDAGIGATTSPKLLRPPYAAGLFTTRLENLAAQRSYSLCGWTVDTKDWEDPPADTIVERVTYGDYRTPPVQAGGVILMHGGGENTHAALQRVIDVIRAKGLRLERLP